MDNSSVLDSLNRLLAGGDASNQSDSTPQPEEDGGESFEDFLERCEAIVNGREGHVSSQAC